MPHEPLAPLSTTEMELLEEATHRYEYYLDGEIQKYLAGPKRGLEEATVRSSRLGRVTNPMPGHEKYEGWLAIPYLGPKGEVLKIRFRCWEDHDHKEHKHGKYEDLPHSAPRLFNVSAVLDAEEFICITEGELDTLILKQIGIPSVALAGGNAWRPHYRRILAGFDRIYLFGDPDNTGREMNMTIQRALRQSVVVKLDADVTDTYVQEGPMRILEALMDGGLGAKR